MPIRVKKLVRNYLTILCHGINIFLLKKVKPSSCKNKNQCNKIMFRFDTGQKCTDTIKTIANDKKRGAIENVHWFDLLRNPTLHFAARQHPENFFTLCLNLNEKLLLPRVLIQSRMLLHSDTWLQYSFQMSPS